MVRVVKDHTVRRNEILDVAQQLMVTTGYEQMTIQDILDGLGISKGAFYHYFRSKQELLEAIIERMLDDADKLLAPIINDPALPALEKFERFFTSVSDWKTAQKSFVLALLKVWYQDDNAIVRQKLRLTMVQHISPLIATIIRQGNQEGVMAASDPDLAGEVALQLVYDLSDTMGWMLASHESGIDSLERIESKIAGYSEAIERVLGAAPGSLYLVDMEVMRQWVLAIEPVQA